MQQLGSIYESILEYAVEADGVGSVRPRADNSARHRSGSYYTPEDLVGLIIERAVGPLVDEVTSAFANAVAAGVAGEALAALDPATRMLDLKIVDPAMGSGHFLVSLSIGAEVGTGIGAQWGTTFGLDRRVVPVVHRRGPRPTPRALLKRWRWRPWEVPVDPPGQPAGGGSGGRV